MPMSGIQNEDYIRLKHIIDACAEILLFIEGKTFNDLVGNRMLALSIMKDIEIIGEAAGKISNDLKKEFPVVPWADITGMRNRLIHSYFDIDMEIVWKTAIEDVPLLKNKITEILS
jgi:uncharacterized protein with HEPN domain